MLGDNSIIIRDFIAEDMENIVSILQSVSPFIPESSRIEEIAKQFLENKNCFACVAVCNGFTIGIGSIFILERIRGGSAAVIEDVAVHEGLRNQGIGRLIVGKLLDYAKKKGCFKVTLVCSEQNFSFYEKLGFKGDYKSMKIMI